MHRGKSVLVIDDDPFMCELLATLLTSEGLTVRTATTVAQGVALLQQEPADLIITDLTGPPHEVSLDELRPLRAVSPAPIIVLTGRVAALQVPTSEVQVAAVLLKPSDVDDLLAEVRASLDPQPA